MIYVVMSSRYAITGRCRLLPKVDMDGYCRANGANLADPRNTGSPVEVGERRSTGIPALDDCLEDGYWSGSTTLVAGPSGFAVADAVVEQQVDSRCVHERQARTVHLDVAVQFVESGTYDRRACLTQTASLPTRLPASTPHTQSTPVRSTHRPVTATSNGYCPAPLRCPTDEQT
jgi:hypothetical protein